MELVRKGQRPHSQCADAFSRFSESKKVRARFRKFGRSWRKGEYDVELEWTDIRYLIGMFAQMDIPEATHLNKIILAADAAERLESLKQREQRKNQRAA